MADKPRLTRRQLLKLSGLSAAAMVLGGGGGYAYAREIEPTRIGLTRRDIHLPQLPPAFEGFRIVQISDIHADDWMTPARLEAIVQMVNAQQPDLVAMTGDFLWYEIHRFADGLSSVLRNLSPQAARYAVLGNHDLWSNQKVLTRVLDRAGVHLLVDSTDTVIRGGQRFQVAGLNSVWQQAQIKPVISQHRARVEKLAEQIPDGRSSVLLVHEPDIADITGSTGRFDLQLSGHSHGGQVQVPFYGPLCLPTYGRKYPQGLYQVRGMHLYTNRGVGMVPPRIRFNCPPEITLLTLTARMGGRSDRDSGHLKSGQE